MLFKNTAKHFGVTFVTIELTNILKLIKMNFLDKLFGAKETNVDHQTTFWKNIESEEDLNKALEESQSKKVAIFKHSTRCFISKTVLKNFEKEVKQSNTEVSFYYLDLIAFRSVSNLIAEKLDVTHQSPQLLVIENGVVVNHASHQDIELQLTY